MRIISAMLGYTNTCLIATTCELFLQLATARYVAPVYIMGNTWLVLHVAQVYPVML